MTEAVFNEALDKYHMTIMYTIYNMVYSQELARDLAQEVFVRLWENRKKIRSDKPLYNYLYRIAINLSIDYLRKSKSETPAVDPENLSSSEEPVNSELYDLIIYCTKFLQPKQKAVFILRDIEGLDFEDIEVILDSPVGNLQSNLYLARTNLRRLLAEKFNIEKEFLYDM